MVRKEILQARSIPRDAPISNQEKQNKITFNITYHPVFRDVRKILEELHVILASDDGHKKVFPDVPMIGFKINKSLKAQLVRSQLPDLDEVKLIQVKVKMIFCHFHRTLNYPWKSYQKTIRIY